MDFDLTVEQQDLVASVRLLLDRHAGPERARKVAAGGGYDSRLMEALVDTGFVDVADAGAGPLEAELVVELVAEAPGCAPVGARALVAPRLLEPPLPNVIALAETGARRPVRFATQADAVLVARDDEAVLMEPGELELTPVGSPFGYPVAYVGGLERGGTSLPGANAEDLRRWWRIALAAEMVGCMEAALRLTVAHVSERRQFGRPLGALQVLQHRLAELHLEVEGARWLTRRAAWEDGQDAASAATAAADAAERVVAETHQLSGAMGLTLEYDLYLWTMRLTALRLELGGSRGHATALAQQRWGEGDATGAGAGRANGAARYGDPPDSENATPATSTE